MKTTASPSPGNASGSKLPTPLPHATEVYVHRIALDGANYSAELHAKRGEIIQIFPLFRVCHY